MDRSWINCRLFSKPHLDRVSNFMKFVSERYDENEEILCPCRRCLNRIHQHKGIMNEVQEDDDDDKIHDMVEELYVAEEEGNKKKIYVCSSIRRDEA